MPKIMTYKDMTIELLNATENPAAQVGIALGITMKPRDTQISVPITTDMCQYLIDAEHTSVFEHVSYTFLIQGISRSLLAQLTRQRTAKPTSGSQHYQNYSSYPCAIHPIFETAEQSPNYEIIQESLNESLQAYEKLLDNGVAKEEARQVLPNAATVNYLWTIDARNLLFFLRVRTCNRNVMEMRIFANRVLAIVQGHFPQLFFQVGPQCFMDAHFSANHYGCRQGKMQCKNAFWRVVA